MAATTTLQERTVVEADRLGCLTRRAYLRIRCSLFPFCGTVCFFQAKCANQCGMARVFALLSKRLLDGQFRWPRRECRRVFPRCVWQGCVAHFFRIVFSHVPRPKMGEGAAMPKAIHASEDIAAAQGKRLCKWSPSCAPTPTERSGGGWVMLCSMVRDRFDRKVEHTFDIKPDTRVEVITGTGQRRRWPREVKARIVMESLEDGAIVSAVVHRHGIRPQQLFAWRREVGAPSFAPVVMDGAAPALPSPAPRSDMARHRSFRARPLGGVRGV
jgi:Transposase/Transposase, Mutator family